MRYTPFVLAALVATGLPSLASAQRVSADIRIGSGPVDGRIVVGEPVGAYPRRIVVVDGRDYRRSSYGEVEVYRIHRGHGWWRNRGYRAVSAWYDTDRDRYYDYRDRYDDRDGLREVVIYERDGRYYSDLYDRYERDGRYSSYQYDRRGDRGYERSSHDRDGGYRHHDRGDDRDNRGRD